jgi:hypothetical protein
MDMKKGIQVKYILKIRKKSILIFLSSFICFGTSIAQEDYILNKSDALYSHIYNAVIKNLTFHHTYYAFLKTNNSPGHFFDDISPFGGCAIPNEGLIYDMAIYKRNNLKPDSIMSIYEYEISDITYSQYSALKKDIAILHFIGNPEHRNKNDFLHNKLEKKGLIGLYEYGGNYFSTIIFVSGELFLDNIKEKLFKGYIDNSNIYSYVYLKYYNYDPISIRIEVKGGFFLVFFYSKTIEKNVKITVPNSKSEDKVHIID